MNTTYKKDKVLSEFSPELSDDDYFLWRDLIRKKIGLNIRQNGWPNKETFLKRRLAGRMKELAIRTYRDYFDYVTGTAQGGLPDKLSGQWSNYEDSKDPKSFNDMEWQKLAALLMNHQSSFFRHSPSFDALMTDVLPEFLENFEAEKNKADTKNNDLFMWSAGCSKGQEAYSLAMAFDRISNKLFDRPELTVFATDISPDALYQAEKGDYSFLEIRDMPSGFRDEYMIRYLPGKKNSIIKKEADNKDSDKRMAVLRKHGFRYRVADSIKKYVRFGKSNLMSAPDKKDSEQQSLENSRYCLPGANNIDIIFCHNVLIYFNIEDRAKTISNLLFHLKPGGYLFLAPGENAGIRVGGASVVHFKETLSYRRNEEAVDVHVIQ